MEGYIRPSGRLVARKIPRRRAPLAYDDLLGNVLGFRAVVERGELVATLSRQNRQSRSYTLGPGTHQTVNVPPNIQLGRDPETGAFTITRGNAVLTLAWSDA